MDKLLQPPVFLDKAYNCAPTGVRTFFPMPSALSATFDKKLIYSVGKAIGEQISLKVAYIPQKPCVYVPPCTSVPRDECFCGDEDFIYAYAKEFVRGLERGGAVAFMSIPADSNSNYYQKWIDENASKGIALQASLDSTTLDFARFRGLIYNSTHSVPAFSSIEELRKNEDEQLKTLIEGGVSCGAAFTPSAVRRLSDDSKQVLMQRLGKVLSVKKGDHKVTDLYHKKYVSLSHRAALDCITLIKNDGILPLGYDLNDVVIIGDAACDVSYLGCSASSDVVSLYRAFRKEFANTKRIYYLPADLKNIDEETFCEAKELISRAALTLFVDGKKPFSSQMDRADNQRLKELVELARKSVTVYFGAPNDLSAYKSSNAIIIGWNSGEQGGIVTADCLFSVSPSGKLPYSVVSHVEDGVTHYYPFGYGLCYGGISLLGAHFNNGNVEIYTANKKYHGSTELVQIYAEVNDGYKLISAHRQDYDSLDRRMDVYPIDKRYHSCRLVVSTCLPHSGMGDQIDVVK